jgi:hypothetical protein
LTLDNLIQKKKFVQRPQWQLEEIMKVQAKKRLRKFTTFAINEKYIGRQTIKLFRQFVFKLKNSIDDNVDL